MKTPQQSYPKLARAIGVRDIYLKREDLHKYGSHKGRSIPLMIKRYAKDGIRDFVISSSGNAALAAIYAVAAYNKNNPGKNIALKIFVGKKIDEKKFRQLESNIENQKSNISITRTERPKQTAFQLEKNGSVKFLRQSTDDLALEGYTELAEELNKIPTLEAIFIPTSSGTTAQGIGEAFKKLKQRPQIHIVQTQDIHPIAEAFRKTAPNGMPPAPSTENQTDKKHHSPSASAIVDKVAHRKEKVLAIIKKSGGSGWIVNDNEIKIAQKLAKENAGIDISPNSALSIAGLVQAAAVYEFTGAVVCLITGH